MSEGRRKLGGKEQKEPTDEKNEGRREVREEERKKGRKEKIIGGMEGRKEGRKELMHGRQAQNYNDVVLSGQLMLVRGKEVLPEKGAILSSQWWRAEK